MDYAGVKEGSSAMAPPRLTPDKTTLRRWIEEGLTHAQMAERVYRETGEHVSRSSISAAISRLGLSEPTPRYERELPWRVKVQHLKAYPARMLRLLGRRNAGKTLTEEEQHRLSSWLELLDRERAVVAYDPDSEEGFFYVARKRGERSSLPIRRERVYTYSDN